MLKKFSLFNTFWTLILHCCYESTTLQVTSPVQTIVGWNASFSMQLDPYPNRDSIITVLKNGVVIMRVKGTLFRDVADRFEFTGNTLENQISFILRNVTLGDAGTYTATETGIPPGGEQTLIVKASPSKPQIIALTSSVLGSDYRLNCSSVSNSAPPDHGLTMMSEWKVDDQLITIGGRYKVQGTELTIASLTRQDNSGRLTCVTYEDSLVKSVPSNEHVIDVKYGPDNVQLNPSGGIIKAIENHSVIIQCTADCNPTCNFQWRRGSVPGYLKPNQTLMIDSVGKSDTDNYTCTVSNGITGRSQNLQTTLITIYGAKIVNLSVQDSNTVKENSSAIFQCQVDSNPLPTITWRKEGTNTVLKTESGVVQSLFRIESAQCQDTNNYTCSAYNGVWTQANETLQFFVKCHPRTNSEVPLEIKVYKKLHEAAFLRYEVISYPLPKFTWMFLGNGSESRDVPDSASLHVNGRQSELRFTSLNIDDFGYYSVMADNSLPPTDGKVFEIIMLEEPSPVVRDFQVGAVVGGVVGGIVLVIAIVVVAVVIKRRTLKPTMEENMKREALGNRGPEYINTAFRSDINTTEYEALQSDQTGSSQYEALNDPTSKLNQSTDISISPDPGPSTGQIFYDKLQPCDTNQSHIYSSLSSPGLDEGENKSYENAVMSTKYIHE